MIPLFKTITIDPPWNERGGGGRGIGAHYAGIPRARMASVILRAPLWRPDPAGCAVWCWTTVTSLVDGVALLGALGVGYVSHAVWNKSRMGMGQRLRVQHEICLLGIIGKVELPSTDKRPRSVITAPTRGHSIKPAEADEWFASTLAPRAELFARRTRAEWWTWGTFDHDAHAHAGPSHDSDGVATFVHPPRLSP